MTDQFPEGWPVRYRAGATTAHTFHPARKVNDQTAALCFKRPGNSWSRTEPATWLGGPGDGPKAERARARAATLKRCRSCLINAARLAASIEQQRLRDVEQQKVGMRILSRMVADRDW